MSETLINAIADLKEKDAIGIAEEIVNGGLVDPIAILDDLRMAMEIVGKRYEEAKYFLPELLMSGMIMNRIKGIIKDKMSSSAKTSCKGRVLIGTIEGDIHNIGKDIVTFMLDCNGFEVLDLGVNVPAREFLKAIDTFKPQVVGLSAFLTLAYDIMKKTIQEFEAGGVRDQVKIMIGGGVIDQRVVEYTGADGFGRNAMDAIRLTKCWTRSNVL